MISEEEIGAEAMRLLEEAGVIAPDADIGSLLDDLVIYLKRFVVFQSDPQADAIALWVVHTHALEAADCTPYLWVSSAAPTSGKTRLTEVLELLVHEPLRTADASTRAIFREIEKSRCTVILDEIDTKFGGKASDESAEELRGLVNAGFNRGAKVLRCDGKNHDSKRFEVFCPKVLAGLGEVPDTVAKRSIPIRLERKFKAERVERFRRRLAEPHATELRDAIAQWAEHHSEELREARPSLPDELTDRQQDAWEPLLAIADIAGDEWPARARGAAIKLHRDGDQDEGTLGVLLLGHLREALGTADRITTEDLLRALVARDDAPWAQWWANNVNENKLPGPASKLARILKPFGVKSKSIKLDDGRTPKGFLRDDLWPLFERYLPAEDAVASSPEEKSPPRNFVGPARNLAIPENPEDEPKSAFDQEGFEVATFLGDKDATVPSTPPLVGWIFGLEGTCEVCGQRCIATDPESRIRHPKCAA